MTAFLNQHYLPAGFRQETGGHAAARTGAQDSHLRTIR